MSATLTQDEKKQQKRDAEAARRKEIKQVAEEFAKREAGEPGSLNAEQRQRALNAPAGIRKKTFEVWVREGLTSTEQAERANAEREAAEAKGSRTRAPKDPEAAALAASAKESAPDLKSRFRPLEGRQLLDLFEIEKPKTGTIVVRREKGEEFKFASGDLKRFRDGGDFEKKGEVRAALATLGQGTKLWGRKFAAFILVRAEEVS
jgi:hypothetical protein